MKTLVRAFLIAIFLPCAALLVFSNIIVRLAGQSRLAIFVIIVLAGILADLLAFALVPERRTWWRRFLHFFGLAVVFLIAFYVLGSVVWAQVRAPALSLPGAIPLDLSVSWPFVVMGAIGFAGYLLVSAVVRPIRRLPRLLERHLVSGEEVLCKIQQTRWKHPITPDTLMATNRHLVVYRPTNLGLTSIIEDYNYIDIANIRTNRGLLFTTLVVTERFEGNDLEFRDMPKQDSESFVRIVTEQIFENQSRVPLRGSRLGGGGEGLPREANSR